MKDRKERTKRRRDKGGKEGIKACTGRLEKIMKMNEKSDESIEWKNEGEKKRTDSGQKIRNNGYTD